MGGTDRIVRSHDFTRFDTLWNQRKFGEAKQVLYDMGLRTRPDMDDGADYWVRRATCALRFFDFEEAERCMQEVRQAYGYDRRHHEMAYDRDLAVTLLRWRKRELPLPVQQRAGRNAKPMEVLLERSLSSPDRNDEGVAMTILGRWFLRKSHDSHTRKDRRENLLLAVGRFKEAELTFDRLGDKANEQWRINNRFHWYMALRSLGSYVSKEELRKSDELYSLIQRHDPSAKRRWAARLMWLRRGTGIWLAHVLSGTSK